MGLGCAQSRRPLIRKGIPSKGLTHPLYHRSTVTLTSPDTGQRHIIKDKTLLIWNTLKNTDYLLESQCFVCHKVN